MLKERRVDGFIGQLTFWYDRELPRNFGVYDEAFIYLCHAALAMKLTVNWNLMCVVKWLMMLSFLRLVLISNHEMIYWRYLI